MLDKYAIRYVCFDLGITSCALQANAKKAKTTELTTRSIFKREQRPLGGCYQQIEPDMINNAVRKDDDHYTRFESQKAGSGLS